MTLGRCMAIAGVLASAGCGRLDYELLAGHEADAGGPSDAAACTLSAFGAPVRIDEVSSTYDDWGPRLSGDELTMWFMSWRVPNAGESDIWTASRADRGLPFGAPTRISELSSAATDDAPWVEREGLTTYLSSSRSGAYAIYVATRAANGDPWGMPVQIGLDWPVIEALRFPALSPDELDLYVSGGAASADDRRDFWYSHRADRSSPFGALVRRDDLSHTGRDDTITFSSDYLEAIFSSDRPGGHGGLDLWRAARPDRDAAFGSVENLGPMINSAFDETGAFLSEDGKRLYYNYRSNVGTPDPVADIWIATRDCVP